MTKMMRVVAFSGALASIGHAAAAQTPAPDSRYSASVSVGAQVGTRTISQSTSFVLYNENATINGSQKVGSGFLFDVGADGRVWRKLSVGLGLWTFHGTGDQTLTATIPNPLVFGHPVTQVLSLSGQGQTSVGIDFKAIWPITLTDKLELAVFGGPTIIHTKQDLASVSVAPGTSTASAITGSESATTGKAGNVGVDLRYRVTNRYGVGFFARYAGGKVNLPSAPSMSVGGGQIGVGVRIRF